MEQQITQPQAPIPPASNTGLSGISQTVFVSSLIFIFVFGAVLGYVASSFLTTPAKPEKKTTTPQEPIKQQDYSNLPISFSLLKNPMVNQWRGAVKGKLKAKDENAITLEDDKGNSLTIPIKASEPEKIASQFFIISKTGSAKESKIADFPLGVSITGDFFVVPGTNDEIFGAQFIYHEGLQD